MLPTSQCKIAKIEFRNQFWMVFYTSVKTHNRKKRENYQWFWCDPFCPRCKLPGVPNNAGTLFFPVQAADFPQNDSLERSHQRRQTQWLHGSGLQIHHRTWKLHGRKAILVSRIGRSKRCKKFQACSAKTGCFCVNIRDTKIQWFIIMFITDVILEGTENIYSYTYIQKL